MRWMTGAALVVLLGLAGPALAQGQLGGSTKDGSSPGKPAEAAQGPAEATTQCPDNAAAYAGSDESFACLCPPEAVGQGAVWGSDVYTADSGVCRAALHAGVLGRRGGAVTVQMLPGQGRYLGLTRNGVQSQNYGAYDSSFRFAGGRPPAEANAGPQDLGQCPDNLSAFAGETGKLTCSCIPEQIGQGAVWGTDTYTADSGTCRAAVHAGAIRRGGGPVMVQMLPGQGRYVGTTRNGVESQNYGAYEASFRFEGAGAPAAAAAPAGGPTRMAQCPDNMMAFEGSGETVICGCAPERAANGTSVWGTDVYTADSATCRAALHAGAVTRQGGEVTIRMLPGQARYPGTTRNGVQSTNYGTYGSSFRFEGTGQPAAVPAPGGPTRMAQCPDSMRVFAGTEERVICGCPAERTVNGSSVWGTDIYTADSATCRAALHAGAVTRQGGEVTVQMMAGQARYPGTTRNGIQSSNYGAYESSFRFEGLPQRQGMAPASGVAPASTGPQQCPDNLSAYAGSDEALTCLCPGEATVRGGSVWGTDIYTADSATCRAAVHAGVIGLGGGSVSLRMQPGQPRYPGTTRNGIASSNYGAYDASFRFEGGQRAQGSTPMQAPVAESLKRSGQVQLYVTFRTNSADLDISAAPVLMQVRDALLADPSLRLRLIGHTDNQGSPQTNVPLSIRRAEAVRMWLAQNGVPPDRLQAEGRGQTEPIADNGSEAGRALNRRVQAVRVP